MSQEAQLGSQDELERNHLKDLFVSLLSRTLFTTVSQEGKNENIQWIKILHKLFLSQNLFPELYLSKTTAFSLILAHF